MSEAKSTLLERIETINERYFFNKNLRLSYKSKCSTSWLEVDILRPDDLNIILNTDKRENNNKYSGKIQLSFNQ